MAQLTYQEWAKLIAKPESMSFKVEIGALQDFKAWLSSEGYRTRYEHPTTERRVRFDDLPDAEQKAIRYCWMWGGDESKRRVQQDNPPLADSDNTEEEIAEDVAKQETDFASRAMGKIDSLDQRKFQTLESLDEDEPPVVGIVRQPVIFVNSRLPAVAKHDLARHKVAHQPIDRGVYFSLGRCIMLGVWEGEVREQMNLSKDDPVNDAWVEAAVQKMASDPDHEEVFTWMRQQGLTVAAHPKRRGEDWYTPLMPVSFARNGGYVDEWSWPGRGR